MVCCINHCGPNLTLHPVQWQRSVQVEGRGVRTRRAQEDATFTQFVANVNEPVMLSVVDGSSSWAKSFCCLETSTKESDNDLEATSSGTGQGNAGKATELGTITLTWAHEPVLASEHRIRPGRLTLRAMSCQRPSDVSLMKWK